MNDGNFNRFEKMGEQMGDPDEWEIDAQMAERGWPKWVSAYDHNRNYGGSEEGGWWYDTGILLATIPCENEEQIEEAKARLHRIYGPQFAGHRDIGSVLCEGVLLVTVDDEMGTDWPTERPHYE